MESTMKVRIFGWLCAIGLLASLAVTSRLSAQNSPSQEPRHYRVIDLGTLGGPESAAFAVNKDGSVIVGSSLTSGSSGSNHIFRWTAKTGMEDVLTVLDSAGVHTADKWVQLNNLVGLSTDGTVMVGYGLSPKTKAFPFGQWTPFRIVLPLPGS